MWSDLALQLHHFHLLERLDMSFTNWTFRSDDGLATMWGQQALRDMRAAMLRLPPSLRYLDLSHVVGVEGGADWHADGVFEALATMPRLTYLDLDSTHLDMEPALGLLRACAPSTELYVSCDIFELEAGDTSAAARRRCAGSRRCSAG